MLKAPLKPALTVTRGKLGVLFDALFAAGYVQHRGPAISHHDEIASFLKELEGGRQLHVQIAHVPNKPLHVYCHEEASTRHNFFRHVIEAIAQTYNWEKGAHALKKDLAAIGYK